MSRSNRFKKRTSDLSGFDYLEREMTKEGGIWIGPDERDDPPPSKIPLGGEGEISQGTYFNSSTSTAIQNENPTFYITDSGGISPVYSHPYMRVTGSNSAITIVANPQISVGQEGKVLTLFCTDSQITITNGNGVATVGSVPIVLNSGSVAVFFFNSGNNCWNETSRVSANFGIGG